jgi:lipid-binding SYLF domain-containing protein
MIVKGNKTMKLTKPTVCLILAAIALTLTVVPSMAQSTSADPKKDKERAEVRTMAEKTLQRLYKAQPLAEAAVQKAAAYAVFSNTGVKILVAGSGKGRGLAVNNKTRKETFMKMLELQAGFGVGVKKFSLVFVFDHQEAFDNFVNSGWQFGGQATAAAKTGDKGGAVAGAASVSDGIWVYQLTDKGVAVELTAKSTKFSKDDDLN